MLSPSWEPLSNPLDELREIARTTSGTDWEAWEAEMHDVPVVAYFEGEDAPW